MPEDGRALGVILSVSVVSSPNKGVLSAALAFCVLSSAFRPPHPPYFSTRDIVPDGAIEELLRGIRPRCEKAGASLRAARGRNRMKKRVAVLGVTMVLALSACSSMERTPTTSPLRSR